MMKFIIYNILACLILVGTGIVEGNWTDRWRPRVDVSVYADRLGQVPLTVGDWRGQIVQSQLSPAELKRIGIDGAVQLRYVHATTGRGLGVLLVCGRPVPIIRHTPDYCYPANGFEPLDSARLVEIPGANKLEPASFWSNSFSRVNAPVPQKLQILWSWNSGVGWIASKNPRIDYLTARVLYKLYFIRDVATSGDESLSTELAAMRQILDSIDQVLFPTNVAQPNTSAGVP